MKVEDRLKKELKSFQKLWKGGTTRPKIGWEESIKTAEFQDLENIAATCITPFINGNSSVLEIGCGGGFWTIKMVHARKVWCFDALSAAHNKFWKRIGKRSNVEYIKVDDFSCKSLPDNEIDYLFSYDVFCHISYSGTEAYLKNLYPKLKTGADCFIMIADAEKYTHKPGRNKLMQRAGFTDFDAFINDYDGLPKPGRWYFYGMDRFCALLDKYGYTLMEKDVAVESDKLSPIVYFKKGTPR